MRFRRSLGALLPKQAKLGRTDASDKLQSLSRSTKLELMKVAAHIWPRRPSQQWDLAPCLTLACQEVLSAIIFGGIGVMSWVSQGNCLLPSNNNENKNKNDSSHGLALLYGWVGFSLNTKSPEKRDQWGLTSPCVILHTLSTQHGLQPLEEGTPISKWHKGTICSTNGAL